MDYADKDVLVSTQWVHDNLNKKDIRVVEVDYDPVPNYNQGHIPGAVLFDWKKDLNNQLTRDLLTRKQLEDLFSNSGIDEKTTIVLYGDFNNWFAAYAFWDFRYYGVERVRLMNGGRKKWLSEDRPVTRDVPSYSKTAFRAREPNPKIRAFIGDVKKAAGQKDWRLVDVRSPAEYTGQILAPPEYPNEGAQRGGHIPGAANIPWSQAVNEDGTFKSADELKKLYEQKGITPDKNIITYCRIGERSSHTWFVLHHLLGYRNVWNYDGSWSEWGNSVGIPIEK
ncbi:MAG: sulfurtransferase [Candidatus Thermoplasmatota archaeon]|jgi:thiosulfate/3-mercaptopyruvate sulfurtransferase|nr:sulfurtransferase [Candidatus Sysuiplasma jiujiangense]MBX8642296.1 sulfurtransferase [Candidatus Sysuiplasma jiujiangense]MCL4318194.1 sulfurtransferase [Candidatus Thermoplasmatota archaeon]MCL5253013.1 sulfurtransferase [Candidatus Thermoplasmatota archaeon]